MRQESLLIKIGAILDELNIPYIITGGIAVVVWGHPRFTADIDLVIELIPQKIDQLTKALLKIGQDVYVDKEMIKQAIIRQGEFNLIHPTSGLKVDFWVLKRDDPFDQERMARKIAKQIKDQTIYFTSPEDLILAKLLWYKESQSTRQLEDIESILRIQKELDRQYLKKWAKTHSTSEILESILSRTFE